MGDEILKLRDIGLKNVAKQTHIELEYLEYICDKNFDKLYKSNVEGFIKILSRDYNIDLSGFLEEFHKYCSENVNEEGVSVCVAPKFRHYSQKFNSPNSKNKAMWIWLIIILIIIIAILWLVSYGKYFNGMDEAQKEDLNKPNMSFENLIEDKQEDMAKNEKNSQKEEYKRLENEILIKNKEDEQKSSSANTGTNSTGPAPSNDDLNFAKLGGNSTSAINSPLINSSLGLSHSDASSDESEENRIEDKEKLGDNAPKNTLDESLTPQSSSPLPGAAKEENENKEDVKPVKPEARKTAKIYPNKLLWIGIKNLSNKHKRSFSSAAPIDINLSGNFIVLTGHGNLRLEMGDKNTSYNSKNSLRFLVRDGELRQIDYSEYVKLNGGKEW